MAVCVDVIRLREMNGFGSVRVFWLIYLALLLMLVMLATTSIVVVLLMPSRWVKHFLRLSSLRCKWRESAKFEEAGTGFAQTERMQGESVRLTFKKTCLFLELE